MSSPSEREALDFFAERTRRHQELVAEWAERVESSMPELTGVRDRARVHDSSKFSPEEMPGYVLLTWARAHHHSEAADEAGGLEMDRAILAHYRANDHHPEHFVPGYTLEDVARRSPVDLSQGDTATVAMPDLAVAEMACDWLAMSQETGTSVLSWAISNLGTRWKFSRAQTSLIFRILGLHTAT